jgi:hypothetical protein
MIPNNISKNEIVMVLQNKKATRNRSGSLSKINDYYLIVIQSMDVRKHQRIILFQLHHRQLQ